MVLIIGVNHVTVITKKNIILKIGNILKNILKEKVIIHMLIKKNISKIKNKVKQFILVSFDYFIYLLYMLTQNLNYIFKSECNYKRINKISKIKIRNNKNHIQLADSLFDLFGIKSNFSF